MEATDERPADGRGRTAASASRRSRRERGARPTGTRGRAPRARRPLRQRASPAPRRAAAPAAAAAAQPRREPHWMTPGSRSPPTSASSARGSSGSSALGPRDGFASWSFRDDIFGYLLRPATQALATLGHGARSAPGDRARPRSSSRIIKCALLAGFLFSLPMTLWHLWSFVAPGLYAAREAHDAPVRADLDAALPRRRALRTHLRVPGDLQVLRRVQRAATCRPPGPCRKCSR